MNYPIKTKNPLQLLFQKQLMDLLSKRDHSRKELQSKMRRWIQRQEAQEQSLLQNTLELSNEVPRSTEERRPFMEDCLQKALDSIEEKKWLAEPKTLSQNFAQGLHRKKKGVRFINHYLQQKGLPAIESSEQDEISKALGLLQRRFTLEKLETPQGRAKAHRFLASRGYTGDVIQKALQKRRSEFP